MAAKTKPRKCQRCDRRLGRNSINGYCTKDCKIKALEDRLAKSNARAERRDRSPECYARIDWAMCAQEWYLEGTYDSKRRACELRRLGFGCSAKSVGEVPLDNGNDEVRVVKMTVLTITFREDKGELMIPPDPREIAAGLVVEGES